ncbi:hypothetical protein CROQUDRAFT_81382 [Cronartium quercuum f. sp. fusiforme G11]|uniref:DUF7872 domain-containing protein n=1 Tax=Cronartium quercuum f. sp. fusiforme G11 TaxID=708437 RepID=A0A9P6T951_9BASI|nr:hypothetical protein CROQUDRAFT_81382 [Cronartium quercuum f. sp. fusiforme G11]
MKENGISNFDCGIGKRCHAYQPCYPINSKVWYIAFSLQQFTTFYNIYYDAIGYGIAIVQSSINTLFASLFTVYDTVAIDNMKSNLGVNAALAQVTGTVIMDIMLMCGQRVGPVGYAFNMINFAMAAVMGIGSYAIKEPPGPLKDGFEEWSNTAWYLTQYEKNIHQEIDANLKKRFSNGISTEDGIYGILKNGTFLNQAKMISLTEIENKIKNITMALSVNMILHRIGCTEKGQNGAFPTGNRLSYCDKPGGTMYNIILSVNDKSVNEIDNANVIYEFYGYSTELIIKSSIKCQELGKGFNYVPWKDGHDLPDDITAVCVWNLPVCDTRDEKIRKKVHKKIGGWTTAKTCRKIAGLPLKKNG